jgi:hypothetical protein
MRNHKWIAIAVLTSAMAFGAGAASAETVAATGGGCAHMAAQVNAAMESNAQSPNLEQARHEKNDAMSFCSNQLYAQGISHYQRALDLLGAKS